MSNGGDKLEQFFADAEKTQPLIRLWNELDKEIANALLARKAHNSQPWRTQYKPLKEVWLRITDPKNLIALEREYEQIASLNKFARRARIRALATCRRRAKGK